MARVRRPAVAGAFYPADPRSLAATLRECFEGSRGPGPLPKAPRGAPGGAPRALVAGIAPHAGYVFSGPVAAHLFHRLAQEPPPSTVVVLGVNHHGLGGRFALSDETWSTPLGEVAPDLDLIRELARGAATVDPGAHRQEHSIEVEVPFLQTIYPPGSFRLVALQVTFAPLEQLQELGHQLARAVEGQDVLLLASTDLSHYLPRAVGHRQDDRAIAPIVENDPVALYERVVGEDISMCGIAPTTVLLAALARRNVSVELVGRGDSADAEPMDEVVGYASFAVRRR